MVPANGVNKDSAIDEFQRLLDKKGSVRVLEVLLGKREMPVTRSGLMKISGMSQPTVSRVVKEFLEIGIIEESEDDDPKMFRLNMEHPAASGLISAYDALYADVSRIQETSEEFDPEKGRTNEGSPFVELFRYPTNGVILSALLGQPDAELTAAGIARAVDVDTSTVGDNIPILVRIGLVEKSEDGRYDQYQLNRDHPAVNGFLEAVEELHDEHSPREPTKEDATERIEKTLVDLQSQLSEPLEEMHGEPTEDIEAQATRLEEEVSSSEVAKQSSAADAESSDDIIGNDDHLRQYTQAIDPRAGSTATTAA